MVTVIKKPTGSTHPFYEYACLSTDVKPVSLVPENSLCREIDTGKKFYFSDGAWHEAPGRGGGGSGGGGAEKFVVTLTKKNDTWTADKKIAEIVAANAAGKIAVAQGVVDGAAFTLSLPTVQESSSRTIVLFGGVSFTESAVVVEAIAMSRDDTDTWMVMTQDIPTSTNEPLIVTLTAGQEAGRFVGDKTNKEVYDALTAGQSVIISAGVGSATFKLAVQYAFFDGTDYEFAFIDSSAVKNTVSGGANDYVTASLT